jgi:hypothetical protein
MLPLSLWLVCALQQTRMFGDRCHPTCHADRKGCDQKLVWAVSLLFFILSAHVAVWILIAVMSGATRVVQALYTCACAASRGLYTCACAACACTRRQPATPTEDDIDAMQAQAALHLESDKPDEEAVEVFAVG